MSKPESDLHGRKFGRLSVVGLSHVADMPYWRCLCECGRACTVGASSLIRRSRSTKSCGCLSVRNPKGNFGARTIEEALRGLFKVSDSGCWEWRGFVALHGYGTASLLGRKCYVHRLSYMLHVGPIPDGLVIDHTCRNKVCGNPAHLEAVTPAENNRRALADKTHCIHGHEYTLENTYLWNGRNRRCRACARERGRRSREESPACQRLERLIGHRKPA